MIIPLPNPVSGKKYNLSNKKYGSERVFRRNEGVMQQNEEVKMTYSKVLTKDGKPYISVSFERGKDVAEGSIPACKIHKNQGFVPEEVEHLEEYLKENKYEIIEMAKEISKVMNLFEQK